MSNKLSSFPEQLLQKLQQLGLNVRKQSKGSLQNKIISLFDMLQIRTTQNMLLKKENDEIKLQINTIKKLFNNIINFEIEEEEQYQEETHLKQQIDNIVDDENYCNFDSRESEDEKEQIQRKRITKHNSKNIQLKFSSKNTKYLYQQDNQNSYQTHQKQSSFQPQPQHDNLTTRKSLSRSQSQIALATQPQILVKASDISQLLQSLIHQNQLIMNRMNQIQAHYIQRQRKQQNNIYNYAKKSQSNFDDQTTTFSSQHKIRKGLNSINRNFVPINNKKMNNISVNNIDKHQRIFSNLNDKSMNHHTKNYRFSSEEN